MDAKKIKESMAHYINLADEYECNLEIETNDMANPNTVRVRVSERLSEEVSFEEQHHAYRIISHEELASCRVDLIGYHIQGIGKQMQEHLKRYHNRGTA